MSSGASFHTPDEGLLNESFRPGEISLDTPLIAGRTELRNVLQDSFIGINANRMKKSEGSAISATLVRNKNLDSITLDISGEFQQETLPDAPSLPKQQLRAGDVIISIRFMGNLWAAKVPESVEPHTYAEMNTMILRLNQEVMLPAYLTAWFRSEQGLKVVMENAESVANKEATQHSRYRGFYAIKVDRIRDMVIPVPSMDVQREIAHLYAEYADYQLSYKQELQRKEQAFNQAVYEL